MKDLTAGSITRHILNMAVPIALGMLAQIAYQLIDLYFVVRISVAATVGVSAASNAIFLVTALTQVLSVGTATLVSHAVGRRDRASANVVFNQALALATLCGVLLTALLCALSGPFLRAMTNDPAAAAAGTAFIFWVAPGYALMFPWTALVAALRGTGVLQAPVAIYVATLILNAALAPVLIEGWGTGLALGVRGAGLATTTSMLVGFALLVGYSQGLQRYLRIAPKLLRPLTAEWRRIVSIGLPIGGEILLTFLWAATVYYALRGLGPSAQAGFGIGWRLLQAVLLPGIAIGYAAGPVVGQNFGARDGERVREAAWKACLICAGVMGGATLLVQWQPALLVAYFEGGASTLTVAADFLQLMSLSFVAQGFVYTCSRIFQALGNTIPALLSSAIGFIAFAVPAIVLSRDADFSINQLWFIAIAAATLQATISLGLLLIELKKCSRQFSAAFSP